MPKIVNGDIELSVDESADNQCPICQQSELSYDDCEIIDQYVVYNWTCIYCGAKGKQYDKTVFDGFEVSFVPEVLTEQPFLEIAG